MIEEKVEEHKILAEEIETHIDRIESLEKEKNEIDIELQE
jgi:uncharacterized protein (UPF0335 family)